MMMRVSAAFPSKYLKAADLNNKNMIVKMSHVEMETINETEDDKPVLYFEGLEKGLVLNKTNSTKIAGAYGDEMDDWKGQEIVLFPAMVDFKGDTVEAIRVRAPQPKDRPRKADPISSARSDFPGDRTIKRDLNDEYLEER
jgi:hypothetical protein